MWAGRQPRERNGKAHSFVHTRSVKAFGFRNERIHHVLCLVRAPLHIRALNDRNGFESPCNFRRHKSCRLDNARKQSDAASHFEQKVSAHSIVSGAVTTQSMHSLIERSYKCVTSVYESIGTVEEPAWTFVGVYTLPQDQCSIYPLNFCATKVVALMVIPWCPNSCTDEVERLRSKEINVRGSLSYVN